MCPFEDIETDAERSPISELLWTAWGALGLSSWSRKGVITVVDPEALILATIILGDRRLYLESIDWGIENASLVMPSRLTRFAAALGIADLPTEWIGTVAAHAASVHWASRASAAMPEFQRSGKSTAFTTRATDTDAAAALRLRTAMGATVRTEVVRAMHTVLRGAEPSLANRQVAGIASVASNQSKAVLDELAAAGFLIRTGTPKRQRYAPAVASGDLLASSLWKPWSQLPHAPWELAPQLTHHLTALRDLVGSTKPHTASLEASKQLEALRPYLAQIDRTFFVPRPQGSSTDILRELEPWIDSAAQRISTILARGVEAPTPAELVTTAEHHSSDNPWRKLPFGAR